MNRRVVAELGRPETPDETAARKAESSRIYRSSQNFRNLIAALIVTVAVVAVIVLAVPRGTPVKHPQIDVAAVAKSAEGTLNTRLIAPAVPQDWRVNRADLQQDAKPVWSAVYAPDEESTEQGFLTLQQTVGGAGDSIDTSVPGAREIGPVTIDGVSWTEYSVRESSDSRNISYVLKTDAGKDQVLLYGRAKPEVAQKFAGTFTNQIREKNAAEGEQGE